MRKRHVTVKIFLIFILQLSVLTTGLMKRVTCKCTYLSTYRANVLANSKLMDINYIRIMRWIIAHLSRKIGL